MVEPMGFEPTASSMPSRRAPNCATAPPLLRFDFITPQTSASTNRLLRFHRRNRYLSPRNQVYPTVKKNEPL